MALARRGWQAVQDEVRRRIHAREWRPGDQIPNEADLALEFGCARATVNRALQALADTGLLDRRRKAGTFVAQHPVRRATLDIPIIRHEIENQGLTYDYQLLRRNRKRPTLNVRKKMQIGPDAAVLHVTSRHLAEGKPYVYEDRWVNIHSVPAILDVDLAHQSANEWLVTHAPFTAGDIAFSATTASRQEAKLLGIKAGDALFVIDRITWDNEMAITSVRLTFATGYRMHTTL